MAEQEVRELVQTLEGAEITNEVIEWIREVCKPEALLIDSMSKEFMNNLEKDPAYCNSILKALLYVLEANRVFCTTAQKTSSRRSSK